jgi:hypothetical protein
MSSLDSQLEELELLLLRRGVWAREADRSRCADCGRTPLTGEEVHVFEGRRKRIVCELCRVDHRDTPIATEVVRHATHGQNVRLTARAA